MLHLCRKQERYLVLPVAADAPVCTLAVALTGEAPSYTLDVAYAPLREDAVSCI